MGILRKRPVMLKIEEGQNNCQVYQKAKCIKKDCENAINLGFDSVGDLLKKRVIFDLDDKENKHGRTYIVYKNGIRIVHKASAPGEPPATLFGNLKRSIATKTNGSNELTFKSGNTDKAKYAAWLEQGTSKMAPRPYMSKTVHETEKETGNYFVQYLQNILGKL